MNKKSLIVSSLAAIALTQSASAQLSLQNFDNYTSTADMHSGGDTVGSAGWTASTGVGLTLDTARVNSSPNAAFQGAQAATASRKTFMPLNGNNMHLKFDFYDGSAALERAYVRVEGRVGTTYAGALDQLVAIGKNNNIAGNFYNGRVAIGTTGAVYSDGAASVTATWFTLTGAATRTLGWHTAEIIGAPDAVNPLTHMSLSFYIDGILGGKVSNLLNAEFDWAVIGSGLAPVTTGGTGMSYDNLSVQPVPEPSTIALGLIGGAGLAFGYIRRRAKK